MSEKIINGLIYTILNEEVGPEPKLFIPSTLKEDTVLHVSIKTITILTSEQGMIPKSLTILPFPSLNQKALIKYLQWEDPEKRGSVGNAALTLLFDEAYDIIFYKYMKDLEYLFNEAAKKITKLEEVEAQDESINLVFKDLINSINELFNELRSEEYNEPAETTVFPEEKKTTYQFKIILIGDPMVGKTSTVLYFTNKAFRRSYLPTLGVSVTKKEVTFNNVIAQLVIWDVAGQEKFHNVRKDFYSGSKGIFLVFDLTNRESFKNIRKWYEDVKANLSNEEEIVGYVLGNKLDLTDQREVDKTEAIQLANRLNLNYFETSALRGDNIDEAFMSIAKRLYMINK
ncbi:MAG: GTP-binding protein [Promethearchaeia archaeon]